MLIHRLQDHNADVLNQRNDQRDHDQKTDIIRLGLLRIRVARARPQPQKALSIADKAGQNERHDEKLNASDLLHNRVDRRQVIRRGHNAGDLRQKDRVDRTREVHVHRIDARGNAVNAGRRRSCNCSQNQDVGLPVQLIDHGIQKDEERKAQHLTHQTAVKRIQMNLHMHVSDAVIRIQRDDQHMKGGLDDADCERSREKAQDNQERDRLHRL